MKKFLLGLFLILGAVSFAVPKNLDMNKANKAGFQLFRDGENEVMIEKYNESEVVNVGILFNFNEPNASKNLFEILKSTAPNELKLVSTFESKKAYIAKYVDESGNFYFYGFIPKTAKIKGIYFSILYTTFKNLKGDNLNKTADGFINEIESFLR